LCWPSDSGASGPGEEAAFLAVVPGSVTVAGALEPSGAGGVGAGASRTDWMVDLARSPQTAGLGLPVAA